jgi:acetolactate synthase regulatory subunit
MSKKRAMNWRFVRFDARKRYACPTKREALVSFVARKNRQVSILSSQIERARKVRAVADCMIHKGEY